jgi:hypothetical protein
LYSVLTTQPWAKGWEAAQGILALLKEVGPVQVQQEQERPVPALSQEGQLLSV